MTTALYHILKMYDLHKRLLQMLSPILLNEETVNLKVFFKRAIIRLAAIA